MLKTLQQMYNERPSGGNRAFSPYDLQKALAMICLSTTGSSREQVEAILAGNSGKSPEQILEYRVPTQATLTEALSLWHRGVARQPSPLPPEAIVEQLQEDAQQADRINSWIEQQTHGLIKDIIDPQQVADVVALLITVLYFKGKWVKPFDNENTKPAPFHLLSGEVIEHPLMLQPSSTQLYAEGEGWQALALQYEGDCEAVFLLPQSESFESVERNWLQLITTIEFRATPAVTVKLPTLDLESEWKLKDSLIGQGVSDIFSSQADLSPLLTDSEGVYFDQIIHTVRLLVDEQGTEAAAVTVGSLMRSSVPRPVNFCADRPFFMMIRHTQGTPLFCATVADPR